MSESMSAPWIRDYLIGVAETYGAQLYNAPATKLKKRVQFTDFLTYQEDSYVWAWVSDKDYRVSVRISKDAVDGYKRKYGRSVVDSRFFLVFIGSYRPMFSPRPLGPNARGNTSASHISLEVDYVTSVGIGGHLFGNPRDLESDEKMKEWILGLRQDGGGGNILKLRKQQELAQNKKAPPSPLSPFSLYAPVSQRQPAKDIEDDAEFKPERPHDFKRAYTKRWRKIEIDPWKLSVRPAAENQPETQSSDLLAKPRLDTASRDPSTRPTSSRPKPSPTPSRRQGTPTEWSPSIRGSPAAPEEAKTMVSGDEIQQQDEPDVLPTTPHPPSDTEAHTAVASGTRSPQPLTPAQRIKRSPPPRSSSPPCSSPVPSQLPYSSPLPPSSFPPSSLPIPVGSWRNLQRKVPHPGLPAPRPDPANQGPIQILVPNSDTSGSQTYSQSQRLSQSQHFQHQSPIHPPTFSSCLSKDFQPEDESTPREGISTKQPSKMSTESLPTHGDSNKRETALPGDKHSTDNADADIGKQEGSHPTPPPTQSTRKVEDLEVGTSDTEEEADVLRLTDSNAWVEARLATLSKTQDASEQGANAGHEDSQCHEDSQLSIDDADIHLRLQGIPPQTTTSDIQHPTPSKGDTENVPIQPRTPSPELPERSESRSSMHSLFSASFEDEHSVASQLLVSPMGRNDGGVQEKSSPPHVPRHDSVAWKEPSFISKHKGKGKARAVEESATPSVTVGKKRQRSTQAETPQPKRAKRSSGVRRDALGRTSTNQNAETSALGKIQKHRPSTSSKVTEKAAPPPAAQMSKPRLANFIVDFQSIDLGRGAPIPRLDLDKDIKSTLLRTGRIRTLGEKVEKDGSVYIHS